MRYRQQQFNGVIIVGLLLLFIGDAFPNHAAQRIDKSAEPGKLAAMIVDPNDARISGAKILIVGKHETREVASDDEGFFQVDLKQGRYSVTVTANGFRTARRNIFVKSNTVLALNVKLAVAVMADGPILGAHNKSLDRSGGCAFSIIIGPARLE
jgi:hypothetical protein